MTTLVILNILDDQPWPTLVTMFVCARNLKTNSFSIIKKKKMLVNLMKK
jgi:hypothetical protein